MQVLCSFSPLATFTASTETFGRSDQDNTAPTSTDNSGNSEQSDNTVIFLPSSKAQSKCPPGTIVDSKRFHRIVANFETFSSYRLCQLISDLISSRNPVLDRLTGQLPSHNALRNESYYRVSILFLITMCWSIIEYCLFCGVYFLSRVWSIIGVFQLGTFD